MNNKVRLMAIVTKVEYAKTDIKITAAIYKVGLEDTEAGHVGELKLQGPKKEFRNAALGARFPVDYEHDLSWVDSAMMNWTVDKETVLFRDRDTEVREAVKKMKKVTKLPVGSDDESMN